MQVAALWAKYEPKKSFKWVNIPSNGVHLLIVVNNVDLQHQGRTLKVGGNLAKGWFPLSRNHFRASMK